MQIFDNEKNDGLEEILQSSASFSYACLAEPCVLFTKSNIKNIKSIAAYDDKDLYYTQSILVTSSWNKNDDIFDKAEIWKAKSTPEDKPTNLEHDENIIIGHITSNWPITQDGILIDDDTPIENLPDKYHILTGSVIYRGFSQPDLKDRAEKLIAEIESGTKYVSMECFFKNFDYGLLNSQDNSFKILARNADSSYLTKSLRAYGGSGMHGEYKIGRVLRDITFSGKGFVDKPANVDSIIFNKKFFADKKSNNLSKSGVIENKPTNRADMENIIMSEKIEQQVSEINDKLNTVSASCADKVAEAQAFASDLKNTNLKLEAAMKENEEKLAAEKSKSEKISLELDTLAKEYDAQKKKMEEEMKKTKSDLEEAAATISEKEEALKAAQTQLEEAIEVIAGYKMKEEEMAKKEKNLKRKASLLELGLDEEAAASATEKFENLDDESFEAMTAIFAAMNKKEMVKKEKKEEAAMPLMKMKKKASEAEAADESVLDQVEVEEDIDLSVGSDSESEENSTQAALAEFVRSRLNYTK